MINVLWACAWLSVSNNGSYVGARVKADTMSDSVIYPRLSVIPKQDATGKANTAAGTTEIPGLKGYYLHVPTNVVGKTRAPLVLLLHGGGRNGMIEMEKFRILAEKYGMVLLTGTSSVPGRWDVIGYTVQNRNKWKSTEKGDIPMGFRPSDAEKIDSALKYVLKTQSIDPARIALLGFSDGGSYSYFLGRSNLDIFSRIAPLSGLIPFYGEGPLNPATQFFISGGLSEGSIITQVIHMAALLRADGHTVKTQVGLRGHVDQVEDEDFVWDWLQQSWSNPKVTSVGPQPRSPTPLLTIGSLQKLDVFWNEFSQLPDAIRGQSRMQHQREVWVQVGTEWTTTPMMDLKKLAVTHSEIAEALQKAGLTADEAEAYRVAIIEAHYTVGAGLGGDARNSTSKLAKSIQFKPIDASSTLAKNIEFLKSAKSEFQRLILRGILSVQ